MNRAFTPESVRAAVVAALLAVAPFVGVGHAQTTDTTSPRTGTDAAGTAGAYGTSYDRDDDDDDDDDGLPWGLLGLLGLLGLAGLKPRREPVVHTRTHDTTRP